MSSLLNAELGREIGYLFAEYRMPMPEDATEYFIEGYKEAQHANRRVTSTQYDRKVARLRYSAWCRNRYFDRESVTAKYLESIDTKYCPITRIEMTRGTGLDTDASVDRTDNNAAYVANNIMFMSVRANKAKGTKTSVDMLPHFLNKTAIEGLTQEESDRLMYLIVATDSKLVSLMFDSEPELGRQYVHLATMPMYLFLPNSLSTVNRMTLIQIDFSIMLAEGISCKEYRRLAKLGDKKSRKLLEKADRLIHPLVLRIEREKRYPVVEWVLEDAWREPFVHTLFENWLGSCDKLRRLLPIRSLTKQELEAWHLDSKGYEKL